MYSSYVLNMYFPDFALHSNNTAWTRNWQYQKKHINRRFFMPHVRTWRLQYPQCTRTAESSVGDSVQLC